MAHFVEHMLFKGNEKHPEENELIKYITENGGTFNACTGCNFTEYMFSIENSCFEKALNHFSQFFISPLFNASEITREMHAVDQEFKNNMDNDFRRMELVQQELCNPYHPHHMFSTGTLQTLEKASQNALKEWFQKYYKANAMTLVLYSSDSIETLEKLAVENFSSIASSDTVNKENTEAVYSEKQKGHITYIVPIKDEQHLFLEWEIPQEYVNDSSHSLDLITYILQKKHPQSLLHKLKEKNLATDMQIVTDKVDDTHQFFSIILELTNNGLQKITEVLDLCFSAIMSIDNAEISQALYNEMVKIQKLHYQYQSRSDTFLFVSEQARQLLYEELATYPRKTLLPDHFSYITLQKFLHSLSPINCVFTIMAKPDKTNIFPTHKEKWGQIEYTVESLQEDQVVALQNAATKNTITLPPLNPFIPQNFNLLSKEENSDLLSPQKLIDNEYGTLYFSQDTLYNSPEIAYLLRFKDQQLDNTAYSSCLFTIYFRHLFDVLEQTISDAREAGLTIFTKFIGNAVEISINGFHDKSSLFLQQLLTKAKNANLTEEKFQQYKKAYAAELANKEKELPIMQAIEIVNNALYCLPSVQQKLEVTEKLTFKDYTDFQEKLFSISYLDAFFCGNLTKQEALHLWQDIIKEIDFVPFPKQDHFPQKILNLEKQKTPTKIAQTTSAGGTGLILTLGQGSFDFTKRASQEILAACLWESFFTSLRSKQKTAYQVRSQAHEIYQKLLQIFAVQSNSHNSQDLLHRFEFFLEDFKENLSNYISEDRFSKIQQSLIKQYQAPLNNLSETATRMMMLCYDYDADFDWIQKRIQAFENLCYDDFLQFAKHWFSYKNNARLAISVDGKIINEKDVIYQNSSLMQLQKPENYYFLEKK